MRTNRSLLSITVLACLAWVAAAVQKPSLTNGDQLEAGDSLVSPNGDWEYLLEANGRIVVKHLGQEIKITSASAPGDHENFGSYKLNSGEAIEANKEKGPYSLQVTKDGDVLLEDGEKAVVWSFEALEKPSWFGTVVPETKVSVENSGNIRISGLQTSRIGQRGWSWSPQWKGEGATMKSCISRSECTP
jgi:hypothetical protein